MKKKIIIHRKKIEPGTYKPGIFRDEFLFSFFSEEEQQAIFHLCDEEEINKIPGFKESLRNETDEFCGLLDDPDFVKAMESAQEEDVDDGETTLQEVLQGSFLRKREKKDRKKYGNDKQ